MYLAQLNQEERLAFLSLARHLVARDGKLQSSEQELLQALAAEMGIEVDEEEDLAFLDAVSAFETRRSRRIAALELITLAHVDERYHEEEIRFLKDLFHAFEIPLEQMEAYEAWVKRYLAVIREGAALTD
jgi:uncharacterized tellurite resistance protein B-like protein